MEGAISPGITMLNWNSLNIPSYISNVYSRLREVDLLVKQVNDIRDARIDAVLREISETVFCELPKDDPWTIDEFIAKTQVGLVERGVMRREALGLKGNGTRAALASPHFLLGHAALLHSRLLNTRLSDP